VEIARAAAAQAGEAPTQEQLDGERTRARQAEAEARAGLERAQEELRQVREELGAAAALLAAEQQALQDYKAELELLREELQAAHAVAAGAPTHDELEEQRARADQAEAASDRAL